jgi:hypothetical protein
MTITVAQIKALIVFFKNKIVQFEEMDSYERPDDIIQDLLDEVFLLKLALKYNHPFIKINHNGSFIKVLVV